MEFTGCVTGENVEYHEEAHTFIQPFAWAKYSVTRLNTFLFLLREMSHMEQVPQTRNVAILIYDEVEPLDFAGPFEVFICGSNRGSDFNVFTVAENSGPILATGNLSINPSYTIHNCPRPDLLIVPGGFGSRREMNNETLLNWIRMASTQAELV